FLEPACRIHRIDELPFDRALPFHALCQRSEDVREVATDLTLVDNARKPAGTRENRQQRRLRQADCRVRVVNERDLIAREGELVATARANAVQRREKLEAGVLARIL